MVKTKYIRVTVIKDKFLILLSSSKFLSQYNILSFLNAKEGNKI